MGAGRRNSKCHGSEAGRNLAAQGTEKAGRGRGRSEGKTAAEGREAGQGWLGWPGGSLGFPEEPGDALGA